MKIINTTYSCPYLSDTTLGSILRFLIHCHCFHGPHERTDRDKSDSDRGPTRDRCSLLSCSHHHPCIFSPSICRASFSRVLCDPHVLFLLVPSPSDPDLSLLVPCAPFLLLSLFLFLPVYAPFFFTLSAATFLLCFSQVGSQLSTLCSARIRFFCGLCTGDVGTIEDQRTGGGLVAVREAHAPERWQVTLLRAMAGPLSIKTPLCPTCSRKMILGTTFPACSCSFRAASLTALLPNITTHELLLALR